MTPAALPRTLPEALRTFVRFPSPRLLLVLAPAAGALRLAAAPLGLADLAVAVAVLVAWPLLEWLIHVFVLHFRPLAIGDRVLDPKVSAKHRAHHAAPWQLDLVFIPFHVYGLLLPGLVAFWLAPALALEALPLGLTGLAVTLTFSLHYEWVHFLTHTRYVPRTPPYRAMWKQHRLHHMKNERYWFGVTTRAADLLLGTAGEPAGVETSPTCRDIAGPLPQSPPSANRSA